MRLNTFIHDLYSTHCSWTYIKLCYRDAKTPKTPNPSDLIDLVHAMYVVTCPGNLRPFAFAGFVKWLLLSLNLNVQHKGACASPLLGESTELPPTEELQLRSMQFKRKREGSPFWFAPWSFCHRISGPWSTVCHEMESFTHIEGNVMTNARLTDFRSDWIHCLEFLSQPLWFNFTSTCTMASVRSSDPLWLKQKGHIARSTWLQANQPKLRQGIWLPIASCINSMKQQEDNFDDFP